MSLISREELFLGAPYKIEGVCNIYQLTIDEITNKNTGIGFDKYHYYINLLTMENEDIKEILNKKKSEGQLIPLGFNLDIDIYDYLMLSAANDKTFFLDFKTALSTFIKEEILISTKKSVIIVGNPIERKVITK